MSDGSCLNDALAQLLGYDPFLPDWMDGENCPLVAEHHNLRYFENTALAIEEFTPAVFICPTEEGRAHAFFVRAGAIGAFLASHPVIIGVFLR